MCHVLNTPDARTFGVLMDGPVACGKGKQSKLLRGVHISTGDLARKKCEVDIDFADKYGHLLKRGKYLPDKIVFGLVREIIPTIKPEETSDGEIVVIGDGLVRTFKQADQVGTIFARPRLLLAFSIFVPLEVSLLRAKNRYEEEQRPDDYDEKIIRGRYKDWTDNKVKVHRKLSAKGVTIVSVDGLLSVEDTHNFIQTRLNQHIQSLNEEWQESHSYKQSKKSKKKLPTFDLLAMRNHPHAGLAHWQS